MLSIQGKFQNGKITLANPSVQLPEKATVIITFMASQASMTDQGNVQTDQPKDEEYYKKMREYKRVKAHGNITILDGLERYIFPLNDYSQGGLSFISNRPYVISDKIQAGISDPTNPEMILMELDIEVRGVFETNDGYKIGCMFNDDIDEQLWHGLLQYLG